MEYKELNDEYATYGMLFTLSNRIQSIGDRSLKGITLKQFHMMHILRRLDEAPTLRQMGEEMGCSYQNIKRMAESLQKDGLLKIEQDPKDRRKLLLVDTGKFNKIEDAEAANIGALMKSLYANIDSKDIATSLNTLKRMNRNIAGADEVRDEE